MRAPVTATLPPVSDGSIRFQSRFANPLPIADRIRFSVGEPYRKEFEDKESEQFIALATDISEGLRELYRQSYVGDDDDEDLSCKLLRVE